jgi:hypothetical protein
MHTSFVCDFILNYGKNEEYIYLIMMFFFSVVKLLLVIKLQQKFYSLV